MDKSERAYCREQAASKRLQARVMRIDARTWATPEEAADLLHVAAQLDAEADRLRRLS